MSVGGKNSELADRMFTMDRMPQMASNNKQFDHDPLLARLMLLIYWPMLAVATHWPSLNPKIGGHRLGDLHLDKPIHLITFGILQGLIFRALPLGRASSLRRNLFASILICSTYAYIDEYTQVLTSRIFSTTDLLFNMIGIIAAMGLCVARVRDDHPEPPDNTLLARLSILTLAPLFLLAAFLPNLTFEAPFGLPMGPEFADQIEMRGDHLIHIGVALGATWLLAWAMPLGRNRPKRSLCFALVVVAASGIFIELIQKQTGRGYELSDIVAHGVGMLLAILTGWGYLIAISDKTPATALVELPQKTPSPDQSQTGDQKFVRDARTVMGVTLLSRFTGLGRDTALAALLGLGNLADAFHMGFLLPNLFRRLFGEGALSAAFIPQYAQLLHEDRALAQRFAWALMGLLLVGLSLVVIISEVILFGMLQSGGFTDTSHTAIKLIMLMLPYTPLVCMVALVGGMLQVHGKFGPTAAAPILLNLSMITATSIGIWMVDPQRGVYWIGLAVLGAGALQLLWQVAAVWRDEPATLNFSGTHKPLVDLFITMLPMLAGLAVFQINAAMDTFLSYLFSSRDGSEVMTIIMGKKLFYPIESGSVAALAWSQRLYQFPLGVFGIAVATAIFPALARTAISDRGNFEQTLRNGLQLTVFIGLPASIGLILVRFPLTRLIFQYGEFDLQDTTRVAVILTGYATAIWAYSMTHVLTRGFYALKDAKTPLRITVVNVFLNLTLNLVLIWYLGVAGLAWSTAFCAMWQTFLLIRAIRRYVKLPINDAVLWSWCRSLVLSVIMGVVLYLMIQRVDMTALTRVESASLLMLLVAGGVGVYLAGAWLLKAPELRWLLKHS